jgi:hypothetical protein
MDARRHWHETCVVIRYKREAAMNKMLLGFGVALFTIGAAAFLFFVLPWIVGAGPQAALGTANAPVGPSALAVVLTTVGLAAGSAMIGIGLGRWKRPRPSRYDGSAEV